MSLPGKHSPHALIVGGSLVGLTTALALARGGARVSVLERSLGGHYDGGGGLGVDLPLLADVIGIAEHPPVCQGIDRATTAWPLLVDWLEAHARRTAGIAVHRGAEVLTVGDAWAETADGARYDGDVVIGADGTRSTLRRWVAPAHPDATYAGYLLWRALVPESQLPAEIWPSHDEPSRAHYSGPYRLVTYVVPGVDGSAVRGRRRMNVVWYDPAREDLLDASGLLDGDTVHGSLAADDVPGALREELRVIASQRWPTPWREALDVALRDGLVFATPVAQYRPELLVRGSVALAGDAAHAASPMVGGGFREGLHDAAALANAFAAETEPQRALERYERERLGGAREHVELSIAASAGYLRQRASRS